MMTVQESHAEDNVALACREALACWKNSMWGVGAGVFLGRYGVRWEDVELDDAQPVGLVDEGGPRRAAGLCHDGEVGVAEESEHVAEDAVIEHGRDVVLDDAAAVGDADK